MMAISVQGLRDIVGPSDLGIVLGNAVDVSGHPSPRLQGRIDKALELYKAGMFPIIFVSGGVGKEGISEARVMAEDLEHKGVPVQNIVMDESGNNTFLTAQHAAAYMNARGIKRAFVVSQFYHLTRSLLAFHRFGVSTVYHAHASYFEWRDIYGLCREVPALFYYVFRSYRI